MHLCIFWPISMNTYFVITDSYWRTFCRILVDVLDVGISPYLPRTFKYKLLTLNFSATLFPRFPFDLFLFLLYLPCQDLVFTNSQNKSFLPIPPHSPFFPMCLWPLIHFFTYYGVEHPLQIQRKMSETDMKTKNIKTGWDNLLM